jgi:hypothetical protein
MASLTKDLHQLRSDQPGAADDDDLHGDSPGFNQ